jgi:tetratricopeptide (TPR) repeat protein
LETPLGLSQKLAARYPKSVVAHICHGRLALMLRKFPEASGAFRKALLIQPNLAIGYLGLGMTEAWQNRLAAAMSDYPQVTRLAPKADIGWIALSGCAEKTWEQGGKP